jgi:hypothetical protein
MSEVLTQLTFNCSAVSTAKAPIQEDFCPPGHRSTPAKDPEPNPKKPAKGMAYRRLTLYSCIGFIVEDQDDDEVRGGPDDVGLGLGVGTVASVIGDHRDRLLLALSL